MEKISGNAHKTDNIHNYVRGLVDNNLSFIRKKVEEQVYKRLGIGTENIQQILRVSQDNQTIGYQFIYRWSPQNSYRLFEMYFLVNANNQGDITKIIHTK